MVPDLLKKKAVEKSTEEFVLNADHSGTIEHTHTFILDAKPGFLQALREARTGLIILVIAWIIVTAIRSLSGYAQSR